MVTARRLARALGAMAEAVIRRRVLAAFRALSLARGVECFLIGAGSLLGVLAVLVWEGNELGSASAWLAASGCALLAGASWWFEHSPRPDGVARRLDRRLGMDGMLFTAWEAEGRAEGLGGLLSQRVASKVPGRRALDAVLPASAPLLVLPFLGAGMLAFALDARAEDVDPSERIIELTRAARAHIRDAEAAGDLTPLVMDDLSALAEASEALLSELDTELPALDSTSFESVLDELDRLREEVPVGEEASRALDHAEELLEAARETYAGGVEQDGEGSGGDSSDLEEGEGGRSGPSGGTISGLDPRAQTPPSPPDGNGWRGPDGALGPGTYWPEEHRGVVRRWIESARTRALENDE